MNGSASIWLYVILALNFGQLGGRGLQYFRSGVQYDERY